MELGTRLNSSYNDKSILRLTENNFEPYKERTIEIYRQGNHKLLGYKPTKEQSLEVIQDHLKIKDGIFLVAFKGEDMVGFTSGYKITPNTLHHFTDDEESHENLDALLIEFDTSPPNAYWSKVAIITEEIRNGWGRYLMKEIEKIMIDEYRPNSIFGRTIVVPEQPGELLPMVEMLTGNGWDLLPDIKYTYFPKIIPKRFKSGYLKKEIKYT